MLGIFHIYEPSFGVAASENAAYDLAVEIVTQDLEEEPGLFNQDWLMSRIDEDSLRDALWDDVYNSRYDDLQYDLERDIEGAAEAMNLEDKVEQFYDPDTWDLVDESGMRKFLESQLDAIVRSAVEEELRDPIGYLEDIYGSGSSELVDVVKQWGRLDIDAAATNAVNVDGIGHFLARYNGHLYDLPSGGVYWRDN